MTVWQVFDDNIDEVVATYDSEALAAEHAETYGISYRALIVLSALMPDAADPALREQRARAREGEKVWAAQYVWDGSGTVTTVEPRLSLRTIETVKPLTPQVE